ncbi:MAG: 50S ribosomal protein L4 [bacterium]|nr:50S ribosomal protein L4 [bacterium]
MAELAIFDRTGKQVGTYSIDPTALAESINKQLLHDAVVMYQANTRLGSFRSKSRAEITGTTKKMYRQKGTGNARAGSGKSGVRRGGGHIFAKRPRDFSYRMPRKAIQKATRMAVASKLNDEQVVVIDSLEFEKPATREMAGILKALGLNGLSTLITTESYDVNVYKSGRNIEGVSVSPQAELNALSVLKPRRILITKGALDAFCDRAKKTESTEAAASE